MTKRLLALLIVSLLILTSLSTLTSAAPSMTPEEALAFHYDTLVLDTHTDILNRTTKQGTNLYLPIDRPYAFTGSATHAAAVDNGKNLADLSVDLIYDAITLDGNASNPSTSRLRMMDFTKMERGGLNVAFYAAYTEASGTTVPAFTTSTYRSRSRSLGMINTLYWNARKSDGLFSIATSTDEVYATMNQGKLVTVPSIEGGNFMTPDNAIEILQQYYDLGIRLFLPLYSNNCFLGRGVSDSQIPLTLLGVPNDKGLTQTGKDVIKELGRLGMVADVSHAHELSFWDIIEAAKVGDNSYPVIASHSSCKALMNAARNLTDEQIIALAKTGGVIQIAFERSFVTSKSAANYRVSDIIDHVDYAVALLDAEFGPGEGANYVGFGSDFDGGISTPVDMPTAGEWYMLTLEMAARGYSKEDMAKILGGNMMRVFKKAEVMAEAKNVAKNVQIAPAMPFGEYGYYVNNHQPLFVATVKGAAKDFRVIVDGIAYTPDYDAYTGVLSFQLPERFPSTDVRDAFHVATFEAKNAAGAVARETIIFYADTTKAMEPAPIAAVPAASIVKLNGNKNELTIAITEVVTDGASEIVTNVYTKTFSINNNAADTYTVNGYKVYVDTKGNDQIRACYIVE